MGASKHIDAVTIFAKLRERYNEEHSDLLSQAALARKLGVSKATISRLENDPEYHPKSELLQKYSDFFNVSLDDLTGIKPDNTKEKQAKAIRVMGLSDSVVETVQMISECSDSENLLAVVSALIGSKEYTIAFLRQLLGYFQAEDSYLAKTAMLTFLTDYLDGTVKPQIMNALKRVQQMDEYIASIPDEVKYAETADTPDN